MEWIEDAFGHGRLTERSVITIGNYDGVHLGQQKILRAVRDRATALDVPAVVVTFSPHPAEVVATRPAAERLATQKQKARWLKRAGVDLVAEVRFTSAVAATEPEEFVSEFLVRTLGAQEILVGEGFTWGAGRRGNLAMLETLGTRHGFRARGLPKVPFGDEPVSSSRIRGAISEGRVEDAAAMLTRPYMLAGDVEAGDGRGRQIGWPTLNLSTPIQLLPKLGVYVTRSRLRGTEWRDSVTNVGVRPTISDAGAVRTETHLLAGAPEDSAGELEIGFLRRLRGEQRFSGVDELAAQIGHDAAEAREYFRHGSG